MQIDFEPLSERHLGALTELITDPDVVRFTRIPEPPPDDFVRTWIARYVDGRRDGTCDAFAIRDELGAFAGLAMAPAIDAVAREVELGYMLAPAARGRGIATRALNDLTRWAFDDLGALRAYLIINADNGPSLRVAERCGYVREGVMRSLHLKQDIRVDAALYSRLPSDPPPA
jgi:RimJ/RimL family protein N-acetyltransferase